jgi:spermidine synthase
MYGLIIVIGTLVGLEIPLLTRILSRSASWKESIAHVLSVDYLGALIGSVAFPLFLLPSLGLFRSSFAIGLTNAAVALAAIFFFGKTLPRRRLCIAMSVITLILLFAGLILSSSITRFAEGQLFADHIIYRKYTPYQRIVVTENDRNGELRLYLDKHLQFASKDEYRYHESLVHPVMSLPGDRKRILILGGGDGIAIREVFKYPEVEAIDLVDIDPAITEISKTLEPIRRINQGSLSDPRVTVINQDAFRYILDLAGDSTLDSKLYDRVIIDLPDPHNEVLDKLYSCEFYELVARCLTDTGHLVVQSSSPFYTRRVYWCIGNTLAAGGFKVTSYNVSLNSFGIWGFHLGSKSQATGSATELEIDAAKVRYMTTEVFRASNTFSPDIDRVPTPVNRTFEPKLYSLYLEDSAE